MIKYVFLAIVLAVSVKAQVTYTYVNGQQIAHNKMGDYTYTTRPDGTQEVQYKMGDHTYTNRSNGVSSIDTKMGDYTYRTNSDGTSSTLNTIGNTTYIHSGRRTIICTHDGIYTTCN